MLTGFHVPIEQIGGQSYIIIGAAAMLAGYTRLTYSLTVIMLETTQSINLFLPLLISVMVSNGTARCFNRSLYEYAIRSKQIPLIGSHLPKESEILRVSDTIEG
jgi:chloride channel 7